MSDEVAVQIDRMTSTLSMLITKMTQSIGKDVADIKVAYQQLADRLGSKDGGAAKVGTAVAKGDAQGAPAGSGLVSVQLVKVVNGSSEPVPVTVLKEERSAVGGAITTGLGAIGALAGNFIGGIISGASLPIVIGEMIVLVGEIIAAAVLVKPIVTLIDSIISKAKEIVDKVPGILDLAVRIVLAYLEPVINWAGAFLKSVATLVGGILDSIATLLNDLFAKLPAYLDGLIDHLLNKLVSVITNAARSFLDSLLSALIGGGLVIGNVLLAVSRYFGNALLEVGSYIGRLLRDTARYIGEYILYAVTTALSKLPIPGVTITPSAKPTSITAGASPAFGTFPDLGEEVKKGWKSGADLGKSIAESVFGPAPPPKKKKEEQTGNIREAAPDDGSPKLDLKMPGVPSFQPPVFKAPRDSVLPDLLERDKAKAEGKAAPAAGAESKAPVTFNGGITVNLNVARLDGDNAQATARAIAENVLQEVKRMSEVERFRRGLPTGAVG